MADDGGKRSRVERRMHREDRPEQLRWIAQARCLAAALDLLPPPIVLLAPSPELRVWHANAAARRQFSGEGIARVREGLFLFNDADHERQLAVAVRQAQTLGPGHPRSAALTGNGGRTVATFQVQALDFGASRELPVSEVLMLELHEKAPVEHGLHRLCEEFLLTRKEAECAIGLFAMGSLDAFAGSAGKSIHTVRSQIKAAMQKTATHTQAGLVALVAARLGG